MIEEAVGGGSTRSLPFRLAMYAGLLGLGACALAELGLSWPIPGRIYAGLLLVLGVGLRRPGEWRVQVGAFCSFGAALLAAGVLYAVPWSTRKPFVRRLDGIRVGASEADVRRIMSGYRVLTTVPGQGAQAAVAGTPSTSCDVTRVDGGVVTSEELAPGRETLLYRHSCDGEFDADFGVVELADGKVVEVRFEPD